MSGSMNSTLMMLYCWPAVAAGPTQNSICRICSGRRITPSASRNPAASSKSAPGVRIVTWVNSGSSDSASLTRISSGSSVASQSDCCRARSPATAVIRARDLLPLRPSTSIRRVSDRDRLDRHERVVVRHVREGGSLPVVEQHVALGPIDLQVARLNPGEEHTAVQLAELIPQHHGVAISEAECLRIALMHENGVAGRSAGHCV